jgi:hypothetical protein
MVADGLPQDGIMRGPEGSGRRAVLERCWTAPALTGKSAFPHLNGQKGARERFLTELTLYPPDATSGHAGANTLDEDYLVLSTIHSAKGQEWRIVRILSVVDGCIPSDLAIRTSEEIEEERRLLHVGMTRAQDELDLIVPQRIYSHQQARFGDGHVYASISRFIPASIRDLFDCQHWVERHPSLAKAAKKSGPMTDVPASLLRIWQSKFANLIAHECSLLLQGNFSSDRAEARRATASLLRLTSACETPPVGQYLGGTRGAAGLAPGEIESRSKARGFFRSQERGFSQDFPQESQEAPQGQTLTSQIKHAAPPYFVIAAVR